ncbi:MAG: heme-binding protein [Brevundimonas sp.]|uniref:GlcG/HbpS family heme-binding protein n=1 Tax=Brevundimonas sp. TaxID=1871086 RepID=UPI002733084C|nr:heme-binding protein [Brevundimonas sp.]MDP3404187.1 heme-binding protein [Brevundimonas sp.]
MKALIFALALTTVASAAAAQTPPAAASLPPAPAPSYGPPIGLEAAQGLIDRAIAYGATKGWRLAVAIVEPSGELVAFARMDDTQYGSIHVAQRKAETAARYRLPTAVMEERVQAGRIVSLSNAEALTIGGGVPIVAGERIIGAIGVSGATAAQDAEAALAALAGG